MMRLEKRLHSVVLDEAKCKGCTNCIKGCPTQAIRVRDGKAKIDTSRCIDCGECIRRCPNHAKSAVTDGIVALQCFEYRVALPAPSLYGHFNGGISPELILGALLEIGFDDVYEVAWAAEGVSFAIREYLRERRDKEFLISSACPAIVRLIQVRFPDLIPFLIPIKSPMDIAAEMVKSEISSRYGLSEGKIGAFFITPCPAKAIAIKEPIGLTKSAVDGAISIAEIYGDLMRALRKADIEERGKRLRRASGWGIGWGRAGGENRSIGGSNYLSVDGIHNVINVLEAIEMGHLKNLEYLEALACAGGCVGGPLGVQNPFLARVRIRQLAEGSERPEAWETAERCFAEAFKGGRFFLDAPIESEGGFELDDDLARAILKAEKIEETLKSLPGLDCGSCGAPTCAALAEDIVKGLASETDCIFKLREEVRILAEKLLDLAKKVPPSMG